MTNEELSKLLNQWFSENRYVRKDKNIVWKTIKRELERQDHWKAKARHYKGVTIKEEY